MRCSTLIPQCLYPLFFKNELACDPAEHQLRRARRDIHFISKHNGINREKAFPYSGNFGVSDL